MKKSNSKSFSLHLWNYLLILKILPVTSFKEPEAAIFTLKKCLQETACDSVKLKEAAKDKLILAPFPCSQWEVGTREHRPITEKRILRRVSISIFEIIN